MNKAESFIRAECELGEGPVWDEKSGRLYWVDIPAGTVYGCVVADGRAGQAESVKPSGLVSALALRAEGGLVAAMAEGIGLVDFPPSTTGVEDAATGHRVPSAAARIISSPSFDVTRVRYNDGKCGPDGAFWAGSMDRNHRESLGVLERIVRDGTTEVMERDLVISNGLGWSPDLKYFYLTDSPRGIIYRYHYDAEAALISEREIWVKVSGKEGVPDGLAVDAEGCVWSAFWGGSRVIRFSPDGREIDSVSVPVYRTSSCCFGGAELRTLFITTARDDPSETEHKGEPLAGSVFVFETDTAGLPGFRFGG